MYNARVTNAWNKADTLRSISIPKASRFKHYEKQGTKDKELDKLKEMLE